MAISFKVNVSPVSVDAPKDTSLIWVIREQLERTGTLLTSRLLRRTSFGNAREERPGLSNAIVPFDRTPS